MGRPRVSFIELNEGSQIRGWVERIDHADLPEPLYIAVAEHQDGELLMGVSLTGRGWLDALAIQRKATLGPRPDHCGGSIAAVQLREYLDGDRREFDLRVLAVGTPFERAAWAALTEIPYGQTRSYGEQAVAIGRPGAARAVGRANGRNPIAIVVPCHRVIGSNGSLTGFAGGLALKQWLLAHEQLVGVRRGCDELALVEDPRRIAQVGQVGQVGQLGLFGAASRGADARP